jgi:hypothetical protein
LIARISFEFRTPAGDYTKLVNFVDINRREHVGKPQSRFMYPAVTVTFQKLLHSPNITKHLLTRRITKFESSDFHSGEGANIPRLRGEAKRRKTEKLKKYDIQCQERSVFFFFARYFTNRSRERVATAELAAKQTRGEVDDNKSDDDILVKEEGGNEQRGAARKVSMIPKPDDKNVEGGNVEDMKHLEGQTVPERSQPKVGEVLKSTKKPAEDKSKDTKNKASLTSTRSNLALCVSFLGHIIVSLADGH